MRDPCLRDAIKLVDETRSMSAADAARYLLDRHRTASPALREALITALAGALAAARLRLGNEQVAA